MANRKLDGIVPRELDRATRQSQATQNVLLQERVRRQPQAQSQQVQARQQRNERVRVARVRQMAMRKSLMELCWSNTSDY